jgi:hypothetical protein
MNNFLFSILYFLLKYSCKLNLITIPAYLIFFSLRRIKKIEYGKIKKRFLVLHKSVGIDDITAAFQSKKSSIELLVIKRKILKIFYNCFVKNDHRTDYDYFTKNKNILNGQKKYNDYLFKLFQKLQSIFNFHGFINFNIFYKCEVELQKVSKSLGLEFYSLHKEVMHTPSYRNCIKWIYSNTANKFYGTKILTYNSFEKKLLIESKVSTAKKIKVVGMPRLINSLNIKSNSSIRNKDLNKNIILYFFNTRYLPNLNNPYIKKPKNPLFQNKTKVNYGKLQEKTFQLLYEVLKLKPEVKLTIKSKDSFKASTNIFAEFQDRVNFVEGGSGHDLLEKNGIVIAYNGSTVVFEALAAGKIVFSPYQDLNNGELFDLKNCTICSNSKKFLIKNLINCIENKYNQNRSTKKKIDKLVDLYFNNLDKKAGNRLISELI